MEATLNPTPGHQKEATSSLEPLNTPFLRSKTSLRLRYESEARVILRQFGGLEGVRKQLGLSQRKICQLLLVDPSAWTRWCRDEDKTPPHVIRSLQWYLTLESKDSTWVQWREMILKREPDPNLDRWRRDLEQKVKTAQNSANQGSGLKTDALVANTEVYSQLQQLKDENSRLAQALERQSVVGVGWKLLLLANTMALLVMVFRSLL